MSVVEIAPGVHRCGGFTPVSDRLSWYPSDAEGITGVNCYVVRDGKSVLIIDSGVAAHESLVLDGLRSLLQPDDVIALALTRVVEFDSQGNAARILRTFPISALYLNLDAHFILTRRSDEPAPFVEGPEGTTLPGDEAMSRVQLLPIAAGHDLGSAVGFSASRFRVIDAPLRLLKTAWIYDTETGTFFTSDSFIHGLVEDEGGEVAPILRGSDGLLDAEGVAAILTAKFEWLELADTSRLAQQVAAVFNEWEVRRIAPGVGAVFAGRDRCTIEGETMLKALANIGAARRG